MKRNLIKGIETGYYVICFSMLREIVSYAYIDPSVTTYAIQMIAGVAIAIGAGVGIYWRRAKRKIDNKLGIDENRNKTVEDDIIEIKEENK